MGEGTEEVKYATVADVLKLVEIVLMQQKLIDSIQRQLDIMNAKSMPELEDIEAKMRQHTHGQIIDKTDEYDKQRDIEAEGQRAAEFYRKHNEGII